jgi:hypothetical protein
MLRHCPACGSREVAWIAWRGLLKHELRLAEIDGARIVAAG